MKYVVLKNGKEKKVLNNYQWIYKDDLLKIEGNPNPGDVISVIDSSNSFIGKAFFNPNAKIPLRIITLRDGNIEDILKEKLQNALNKRKALEFGRLVFAEADLIPGLIIDRYGDYVIAQFRNPGILKYKEVVKNTLQNLIKIKGILIRNDFETLRDSSLLRNNEILFGDVPKEKILIQENGLKFYVDLWKGQKTGYFYDQKENRKLAASLVKEGMQGLDLYTYTGSFAVHCAKQGASVVAVDKSQQDLELAKQNAIMNNVDEKILWVNNDVLDFLANEKKEYDFIIGDPPGLAKKKSELKKIQGHLVDICKELLRLLKPDGWLVLFGCSHIMNAQFLTETLKIAASLIRRPIYLKYTTHQPSDHPVLLQMPETAYLTGVWVIGG